MSKRVIIVRGYPGSGRTTRAVELGRNGVVLSIEAFIPPTAPEDVFSSMEFAHASADLLAELNNRLSEGVDPIVVDMPGVRLWELKEVLVLAERNGYNVEVTDAGTPWSRNPPECAARTKYAISDQGWRWIVQRWETNPSRESIVASLSPDERLYNAKCLAAMGSYDPVANTYLLFNFADEASELARTGFIGKGLESKERRRAFIRQMAAEGRVAPRLERLPGPDISHELSRLRRALESNAPVTRTPEI